MSRIPASWTAAVACCVALAMVRPLVLEDLRSDLAALAATPAATLLGSWPPGRAEEPEPEPGRRSEAEGDEALGVRVEVVARLGDERGLVVAAGARDGVRRGLLVSHGGVVVGLVADVERHLSRVVPASHPDCRYGGVAWPAGAAEDAAQPLLLQGTGAGTATARHGSLLGEDLVGAQVFTPKTSAGGGELLYGVVRRSTAGVALHLALHLEGLETVVLDGIDRLDPSPAPSFHRLATHVRFPHGSIPGTRLFAIAAGSEAGVLFGSLVTRGNAVAGRVIGVAARTAWVLPGPGGGSAGLHPAPRGLSLAQEDPSTFRLGDEMTVHVFHHPEEFSRLARSAR